MPLARTRSKQTVGESVCLHLEDILNHPTVQSFAYLERCESGGSIVCGGHGANKGAPTQQPQLFHNSCKISTCSLYDFFFVAIYVMYCLPFSPSLPKGGASTVKMEVKTSLLDNMIGVGDMVLLEPLSEDSFLENLKNRFDHNEIYVSLHKSSPCVCLSGSESSGCLRLSLSKASVHDFLIETLTIIYFLSSTAVAFLSSFPL